MGHPHILLDIMGLDIMGLILCCYSHVAMKNTRPGVHTGEVWPHSQVHTWE